MNREKAFYFILPLGVAGHQDVRNALTGMTSVTWLPGSEDAEPFTGWTETWLIQKRETPAGLDFLVLAKLASLAKLHSGTFLVLGVGWVFFS
jgi:hypothetical protein